MRPRDESDVGDDPKERDALASNVIDDDDTVASVCSRREREG